MTADGQNILVGIYVNFRIKDVKQFFVTLENMTKAEISSTPGCADTRMPLSAAISSARW